MISLSRRMPSMTRVVPAVCMLLLGTMRAAEVAPSAAATSAVPPAPPNSSDVIRAAYFALERDSIVPAKPRVIATAALNALATFAPDRVQPIPENFGGDQTRDADWLAGQMRDLSSPWPVVEAMARAAATAHVGLGSPERRQGIRALGSGSPLSSAGFNIFQLGDGQMAVFDVVKGASGETSGLRVGDVLVRVDGRPTARVDAFYLNTLPAGTDLPLEILRNQQPMTLALHLIKVDVPAVEARVLADDIGYIFVRRFSRSNEVERDTAALTRRAIASFTERGARGLILDLRSALGGSGEVNIASALYDGEYVYSIQQPLSAAPRPVKRNGERIWRGGPVVVLVNEMTVSAGEALALALREMGGVPIIGQTTGGGLTEMDFVPLAPGYAMNIPTGVVVGPITGKVQPGHAVHPDVEIPNSTLDDLLHGRDAQLDAACSVIRKSKSR